MICTICNKEIKNYDKGHDTRTRCGACNTKIRRCRAKIAAINLLGGKCQFCGYDENMSAFEFHHHENNKEFNIGDVANKSWNSIKEEIKKCTLLCSNCHRIEHSNRDGDALLKEVKNYRGNDEELKSLLFKYV